MADDRPSYQGEDVSGEHVGSVGVVTLSRPPVNAFRTQTFEELDRAFAALDADERCKTIVIRSGLRRSFSAGADITELPMPPERDEYRQRLVRGVLERILHATKPVVCVIDGPVRGGGCAIAAVADIRVASRRSSFALPEINVGRAGGSRHLMRILPQGAVRLAAFTGWPIDAEEAYRLGMIQRLTSDESGAADAAGMEIAREIASKSPVAVRFAKEALDMIETMSIADGYRVEQQFTLRLGAIADAATARREATGALDEGDRIG